MIFMRILPGVLKELAKYVPSVLFQAVDWNELAHEVPKLTRRMIQKEGLTDLLIAQRSLFEKQNILLTLDSVTPTSLHFDQEDGKKILSFFFGQLFLDRGIFLDLRPKHFQKLDQKLLYQVSGFWTELDPGFRSSLIKVYDGFYLEDDTLYKEGLEGMGLIKKDWSDKDKEELADIFGRQFGNERSGEMKFKLEDLNKTIIELSHFMLERRVKVSKDFLYLGIYLVTLYGVMEETDLPFPVKNIYLETKAFFNKALPR